MFFSEFILITFPLSPIAAATSFKTGCIDADNSSNSLKKTINSGFFSSSNSPNFDIKIGFIGEIIHFFPLNPNLFDSICLIHK